MEWDLPIIDNVDDVVVCVASNARSNEELIARAILFVERLSEFGEVEFIIQPALVVEHLLLRLKAVILIVQFRPVPGLFRVPRGILSVDVKRRKRGGWFVGVCSIRIKPHVRVECLEDGDLAIHVASG